MSTPCPKCGRLYTWDGVRCLNRFCRYGSDKAPEIDPAAMRRQRFLSEGGRPAVAAWVPGWYELDQPLEVGATADFAFWRIVPDHLRGPEPLVLYNTLWRPEEALVAHGTVAAIRHSELGSVTKVDTRRPDCMYMLTLADGTELLVDAEQDPGILLERSGEQWRQAERAVIDWRFFVKFSALGELTPAQGLTR